MQPDQQNITKPKLLIHPRKALPLVFSGFGLILILVSTYFILRDSTPQTDTSAVPVKVNFAAPKLTLTDIQESPVLWLIIVGK